MTSVWLSAKELVGLPGMPSDARGVRCKADRKSWPFREIAVRGTPRREYPLEALPAATQEHLRKQLGLEVLSGSNGTPLEPIPSLSGAVSQFTTTPPLSSSTLPRAGFASSLPSSSSVQPKEPLNDRSQPSSPDRLGNSSGLRDPRTVDDGLSEGLSHEVERGQNSPVDFSVGAVDVDSDSPVSPATDLALSGAASGGNLPSLPLSIQSTIESLLNQPSRVQKVSKEDRDDARLSILLGFQKFKELTSTLAETPQIRGFCEVYTRANPAEMVALYPGLPAAKQVYPRLTFSTLKLWIRQREGASKPGEREFKISEIDADEEVRDLMIVLLHDFEHSSVPQLLRMVESKYGPLRTPSIRAAQRWIKKYKAENSARILAIVNPDKSRSYHMPAFGSRSADVERPNQRWELDSTPTDLMLQENGKLKRWTVIGVIDVFTRRGMVVVSKTSKSVAVCALLRKAILAWGRPESIKTDNGTDYVSKHVRRACANLSINHLVCAPFSPQEKPHIERFLGTFSHDWITTLPGYLGHSVAVRSQIESRKSFAERFGSAVEIKLSEELSPIEFAALADKWCEQVYAQRPHSGLDGRSPLEVYLEAGQPMETVDPRVLDVLLAEAPGDNGLRTVQKKGIQCEGYRYYDAGLGAYIGKQVRCYFDLVDAGLLYVFNLEGEFLAIAENPEIRGWTHDQRKELAARAKENFKAANRAHRDELRDKRRKSASKSLPMVSLNEQITEGEKVRVFPMPTVQFESSHIASAANANRARDEFTTQRQVAPLTPEQEVIKAQRIAAANAPEPIPEESFMAKGWRIYQTPESQRDPEESAWLARRMADSPDIAGFVRTMARRLEQAG